MKKKVFAVVLSMTMLAALTACGQKSAPAAEATTEEAAVEATTEEAAAEATTEEVAEAADETLTGSVKGVVIDATMNTTTIQAENGTTLTFGTGEDTGAADLDISGVKDGVILGRGLEITFDGEVKGTDTSNATVTALADADCACTDSDALAVAGDVIMAMNFKDMDAFISVCAFPISYDSEEIATADDFKKAVTEDVLFSDEMISSVTGTNLIDTPDTTAGIVLSNESGLPNVIISNTADGWYVTGINH